MYNPNDYLVNEKVFINGSMYVIGCRPEACLEAGNVSCIAVREDGKKVFLLYKLLDPEDPEAYDIENPIEINDLDDIELL